MYLVKLSTCVLPNGDDEMSKVSSKEEVTGREEERTTKNYVTGPEYQESAVFAFRRQQIIAGLGQSEVTDMRQEENGG